MNSDLLQKYLVETRDILFSPQINCPAQLLPQSQNLESDEDQFEQLNFTSPEQMQAYRDLREVILPSQFRTDLIEFLLDKYEPGILEDCHGQIETVLKQLGVWVEGNRKRTKLEHIVGFFDSLQLLWKLSVLVKRNITYSEEQFKMSDQLITYICKEQKEIFTPQARLFPMNFPSVQDPAELFGDKELVSQHFKEEIGNLALFLRETELKLDELNATDYAGSADTQQLNMASLEDLRQLRESLAFLKTQMITFNRLCDDGFRDDLGRIPTQDKSLCTKLGEHVKDALKEREILMERTERVKEIQALMTQIQADLQQVSQIGNGPKSLVSQDAVLTLVSQIKQLKLSFTCQENYPRIY